MNYAEFCQTLFDSLSQRFPGNAIIKLIHSAAADPAGADLLRVKISEKTETLHFSLRSYYGTYLKKRRIEPILRDIEYACVDSMLHQAFDGDLLPPFSSGAGRLALHLVPAVRNPSFLACHPHRVIHDIALVYALCYDEPCPHIRYVDYSLMKRWKIRQEELHRSALLSSPAREAPLLLSCREMILLSGRLPRGVLREETGSSPCYVLSSRSLHGGAAALFYPGVLQELLHIFGDFCFCFPSRNEAVLWPKDRPPHRNAPKAAPVPENLPSEYLSHTVYCCDRLPQDFPLRPYFYLDKGLSFR